MRTRVRTSVMSVHSVHSVRTVRIVRLQAYARPYFFSKVFVVKENSGKNSSILRKSQDKKLSLPARAWARLKAESLVRAQIRARARS